MARGRYYPDKMFNKKQLSMGTMHELEHTNSKREAKKIAKDHLKEHKYYYTYLKGMEKRMKRRKRW